MTTPVMELENLHTYYGHIHALKGISVTVNQGEIVTLVGSNGAGKSTTLRTISGVVAPKRGNVRFKGEDITGMKAHIIAAKGIGHVPEGRRIFPLLTVRENLEVGAWNVRSRSDIEARMEQAFELFPRLRERINQKGGTLSGGEQQMLAIGRALMADPEVLLLDEPSMGLAPVLVEAIFEIITRVNKLGKTILLVEQNALMALEIASRGYVLQTGEIVVSDTAANLMSNEAIRKAYLGEE
ncbi:ABC transporter ATP-binding protein [Anaerolineae bacterium CFX9]|jgi:branched-chain amino acid transport system ATP-binding protein|nr:ABC transporter ATP-binding protein [Kamptonema cortianum]MDL1902237.1 ABC transporter ATP-binding protein [Anaerolineae bacterium CFX9]